MLEDALPVSGAAQALQTLHGRLDRCVPSADIPLLIVHLACSWACAPSIPCLQPGAPLLLDCTEYRMNILLAVSCSSHCSVSTCARLGLGLQMFFLHHDISEIVKPNPIRMHKDICKYGKIHVRQTKDQEIGVTLSCTGDIPFLFWMNRSSLFSSLQFIL